MLAGIRAGRRAGIRARIRVGIPRRCVEVGVFNGEVMSGDVFSAKSNYYDFNEI